MKVTAGKLFSVATDIKHIQHPFRKKGPIKSGDNRALSIFIFAVAGVLTAGIVPVFYLATAYKKIKALPKDATDLVEKTNAKGSQLISKEGENTLATTPEKPTSLQPDLIGNPTIVQPDLTERWIIYNDSNLALYWSNFNSIFDSCFQLIAEKTGLSKNEVREQVQNLMKSSQKLLAIGNLIIEVEKEWIEKDYVKIDSFIVYGEEVKNTPQSPTQADTPIADQNPTEKAKLTWPEAPTSANDLKKVLSQAVTRKDKKLLVASAPLNLIKLLLKNNFFNDDDLLWKDMLPYLSDEHLKELSLNDFTNERQVDIVILGKDAFFLKAPIFDLKDLGSTTLTECRRRFALLANGLDVKYAIEKKQLSSSWLGFLNSTELNIAYSFNDLIDNQLIQSAFPHRLMTINAFRPGEKLRFSQFSPKEIQTYLEQVEDYENWLESLTPHIVQHQIWEDFQYLLSNEQIQALNFETLTFGQMALVIGLDNWKEIYSDLSARQKDAILGLVKQIIDSKGTVPIKCQGVLKAGIRV